jgi:hypothetical protein
MTISSLRQFTLRASAMIVACCAILALVTQSVTAQPDDNVTQADEFAYSAPYTHKNLTIYLISSKDRTTPGYSSLKEAMDGKKLTVYETGTVGELSVKNGSKKPVFIQSGDIVKGGKQDRTLAFDFILPANSQKMPIKSFCVESGRWTQRGNEMAGMFASSNDALVSRELRMAAKHKGEQGKVWNNVSKTQEKLSANVGTMAIAEVSPSSLQLSIENGAVKKTSDDYISKLAGIIKDRNDVVGFAFFINGEFNTADIYSSHELFEKMWPKLLKAAAIEAVAEISDKVYTPADVAVFKMKASKVMGEQASEENINTRTKVITKEATDIVFFETNDEELGSWVHRNYMAKYASDDQPVREDRRMHEQQNIQELNPPANRIR